MLVLYLGWRILRELDLPRGPGLLLLVLFGTPLWYYVVVEPGYKHAADTLYFTGAALLLLLAVPATRTGATSPVPASASGSCSRRAMRTSRCSPACR